MFVNTRMSVSFLSNIVSILFFDFVFISQVCNRGGHVVLFGFLKCFLFLLCVYVGVYVSKLPHTNNPTFLRCFLDDKHAVKMPMHAIGYFGLFLKNSIHHVFHNSCFWEEERSFLVGQSYTESISKIFQMAR